MHILDTSYVENPVKGKKTVKKFKKRRGPKKFNQPAKSPNPNNSETKRGSRKKRKMGQLGFWGLGLGFGGQLLFR